MVSDLAFEVGGCLGRTSFSQYGSTLLGSKIIESIFFFP